MTLDFYQNLPESVNSVFFSIGPVVVYWYSLMWLVAFGCVYALVLWRAKRGEGISRDRGFDASKTLLQDIFFNSLIGAIIGGRVGYVLLYEPWYYLTHPLAIVSPYNFDAGVWTGIYGMSYHGGVIGVALALWWTLRKYDVAFLRGTDFLVPAIPLGYIFGRLGNFLNGELYGRITDSAFGMYFGDGVMRYPSQLFEAVGEGLLLFLVLWTLRNRVWPAGTLTALYLMGYALARFCVEFFREPDAQLGFLFLHVTMGQLLSLIMFLGGFGMFFVVRRKAYKISTA